MKNLGVDPGFFLLKKVEKNWHSPLDSANNTCYSTGRTKEEKES